MRITSRLILSLMAVVLFVALVSAWFGMRQEEARLYDDLRLNSSLLADSFKLSARRGLEENNDKDLQELADEFHDQKQVAGVEVFDAAGKLVAASPGMAVLAPELRARVGAGGNGGGVYAVQGKNFYLFPAALESGGVQKAFMVLFTDASGIDRTLSRTGMHILMRLLAQMTLLSVFTLLVIRWNMAGHITGMVEWMKSLRIGAEQGSAPPANGGMFEPIVKEAATMATNLQVARDAASHEARLRRKGESIWTPERLKEHIKVKMGGRPLFVVSNREPYMHIKEGGKIRAIIPAGGLVTALDPIMKAAGGTWIAHGSGEADFEVTDLNDRIKVPPDEPAYDLRRVKLSDEEEKGYYYGFSNEGLWPLCHIAHIRPNFRKADWEYYYRVNKKFAQIVLEEIVNVKEPCVLIQDYHFALLPAMLKEARPDARLAVFWHIPWPNSEAFGICPWQNELVLGLLGADLIGFQTQFYCNNFLDTVDHTVESRVDREHFFVQKEGHISMIKPFPISVDFYTPGKEAPPAQKPDPGAALKELGTKAEFLGVGVDRLDYTKGIVERIKAVERFLEKYPEYQGRFSFIQLGSPSRAEIPQYRRFMEELRAEVDRVNLRFKAADWKAVVFLEKYHDHKEINRFYRMADVCLVTSLHDGMNLVAKEFVAARDDHGGVLILSRFAGASRQLKDALIINPYDIEQMADAIYNSLTMPKEEIQGRMTRMRLELGENNIFKWAANLIDELMKLRMGEVKPEGR